METGDVLSKTGRLACTFLKSTYFDLSTKGFVTEADADVLDARVVIPLKQRNFMGADGFARARALTLRAGAMHMLKYSESKKSSGPRGHRLLLVHLCHDGRQGAIF